MNVVERVGLTDIEGNGVNEFVSVVERVWETLFEKVGDCVTEAV